MNLKKFFISAMLVGITCVSIPVIVKAKESWENFEFVEMSDGEFIEQESQFRKMSETDVLFTQPDTDFIIDDEYC